MNKKYFIDLFAGCGGLSLGLEQAGFTPAFVNELNDDALNTYLLNRKEFSHLLLIIKILDLYNAIDFCSCSSYIGITEY